MRGEGKNGEARRRERNGKEKKGGRHSPTGGIEKKKKKKVEPHSHESLSSALTYRLS